MKKIYLAISLLIAAAPASVFAQRDFDLHVASLRVLQRRDVQADMKVTPAQRAKMDKFADEYNSEAKAYIAELQKQGKQDEKLPDQTMYMMLAKLKQNVMSVLDANQLQRLRQISLQVYGLNGLLDDTVGTKIGLTKDQIARIHKRYEDGSKQANDLMTNAMKPVNAQFKNAKPKNQAEADQMRKAYEGKSKVAMDAVVPQVQNARESAQKDILAIITPAQKSTYLALQGKKFTPTANGDAPGSSPKKTTKKPAKKPATGKGHA